MQMTTKDIKIDSFHFELNGKVNKFALIPDSLNKFWKKKIKNYRFQFSMSGSEHGSWDTFVSFAASFSLFLGFLFILEFLSY